MTNRPYHDQAVYIIDGARTPFLKVRGAPGPFSASDLAVAAAQPLLLRQPFEREAIDEVIVGCVSPGPDEANVARVITLRLGCPETTPAWTVQRNCASGMQALDCAAQDIASGRADLVLAGGTESMSHHPLLLSQQMVTWLAGWNRARSLGAKGRQIAALRLEYLKPVVALLRGLTDPVVGLSMGQTAEKLAWRFGITREQMDAYAVESHSRLGHAMTQGWLSEIEPLFDTRGTLYAADDGLRPDTTSQSLASLRPVFDKPSGKVTAGNSAQVTDGAAMLLLASEDAVKRYDLHPKGRIVDTEWAALDPSEMGLGPVHSSIPLMQRQRSSGGDIDYWEINEAFAAQVLACLAAWSDAAYCRDHFGLEQPYAPIAPERLNVDGGGVSLGHPVGASGARIVWHLLNVLERNNARRGIATLCVGGGQGGAMLIERVGGDSP